MTELLVFALTLALLFMAAGLAAASIVVVANIISLWSAEIEEDDIMVKVYYPRLDKEITVVRVYTLKDGLFHYRGRESNIFYIIEACFPHHRQIFQELDEKGVSKKVTPRILVEELYEMAIEVNPDLRLER